MDPNIVAATPSFRADILAVLLYTDWLIRYGVIIKPEHFPTENERELVIIINEYYELYHDAPTESYMVEALVHYDEDMTALYNNVAQCPDENLEAAADTALDFARAQAMKLAIMESVDYIRDGDIERPLELVQSALRVGQDRLELGSELVDDASSWVYDELHGPRYPTGWVMVDNILGGGLVAGEYGLIMAPPGRGKTTGLINIGYAMAGLTGAYNVLHVTLEMPAQKVLKRYAARVTGSRLKRGDDEAAFIMDLQRHASKTLRGKLRVIRPSGNTVLDVRRAIDNLWADGFYTEALIVDYPDLMRPTRKRNELRFELADITRELRSLGGEYGMPVWGATQAGRQAIYKEIIHEGDVAEAIEKIAISDVVMSICQTREEETMGRGRLYMCKMRDAEDKFIIPVKLDFERQAIVQRRAVGVT